MRGVAIVSVVICAVTMTVAQGQRSPGPVPAPDRPVPFAPGEMLTYDVSWSNYVSAGTATLSVKERRTLPDGRPAYYVVAEAKPAWLVEKLHHFYYKVDSLLSTRTLLPLQASMYSDEQGRIRLKTTTFVNPTTVDVDLKSAIPVVDGSSAYTLVVRRAVRETVATPIGSLSAWRVEPTLKDAGGESATARHLVLWVSDDARRLPLRFDASLAIGSVRLTLTSVSR